MNANDQTLSFNDPMAGIREDQAAAWAADAGLPAEEYLRRFPTLSNWDALGLVAAEVVIRRERGENPELGEYQARFPHLAEDPSIRFGHLFDLTLTQAADKTGPPALFVREGALPVVPGYLLTEEIGRGGMGVVYRAEDSSLSRDVAVKILQFHFPASGFSARRFVEEGRITGQLQHPAIPPIHQIGALPDGRPFLVMKLIKGRTLATILGEAGDRGHFVAVFEQVCQAVGYAHARKVIHRDLKPANVMVGAFGEVQVMDWGLAKVLDGREAVAPERDESASPATEIRTPREPDSATLAGSILGTPSFMPPEQAGGEIDRVDERSDVFGLGAMLCQILTGKPPYVAKDAEAIRLLAIRGRLDEAYTRLDQSGADQELIALCKRCLSAEPEGRPPWRARAIRWFGSIWGLHTTIGAT